MQSFKKGTKSIAVLILLSFLMTGSLTSCSSEDEFLSTVTVPEESKGTICFINDSTVSENYYYSIEEGLSNAQKGDTVYVIPGSTTSIEEDCIIKVGVTLSLPYEGTRYTN